MSASPFTLTEADVALPIGAFAGGGRHVLARDGRPILAVTEGPHRPYLHPVWTPAGHVVTAERPADHPHHSGIWCAADHVALLMPAPDGVERYDYNLYVDDVFQGRAPGRIRTTDLKLESADAERATLLHRLEWRGPREWAAPDGRLTLVETRRIAVRAAPSAHVIDIVSELTAPEHDIEIGPTRHAFFNARIADAIGLDTASKPKDDRGRDGAEAIGSEGSAWVDFSGPIGGGAVGGIAVLPSEAAGESWFVSDWGVMTVGPMRRERRRIGLGDSMRLACRFVAHDGAFAGPYDRPTL